MGRNSGVAETKDFWDKAEVVAKLLGATLVPLTVALTAFYLNGQISERQANTERSALAIGILAEPVAEVGEGEVPLRRWALDVLVSDFDFSDEERMILLTGQRSLPRLNVPELGGSISLIGGRIDDLSLAEFAPALCFANPDLCQIVGIETDPCEVTNTNGENLGCTDNNPDTVE